MISRINLLIGSINARSKVCIYKRDKEYDILVDQGIKYLKQQKIPFVVEELKERTDLIRLDYK